MKRITVVRILLGILLILNLIMIFSFSAESAAESGQTSASVTKIVAEIVIRDFEQMDCAEQQLIVDRLHPTVRKLAHMTEFGTLGALALLFLQTWKPPYRKSAPPALLFTTAIASADEFNQFVQQSGRAGEITDVLIDLLGGAIAILLIWCISKLKLLISKRIRKRYENNTLPCFVSKA